MSGKGGSGFFCRFPSWGGGGNNKPQGTDRDGGNPDCRAQAQGLGGPCARFSFDDKQDYDFTNDGRSFQEYPYPCRHKESNQEYEARQQAIFQLAGAEAPCNPHGGQAMNQAGGLEGEGDNPPPPPNLNVWQGPQGQAPGLYQGVPTPVQAPD
jgi:hypothetical protein